MATDEEKSKLAKLLDGLDVPEVKLTERCNELVKEFHKKFEEETPNEEEVVEIYENPYVPDKKLLEENDKKLNELLKENKRIKKSLDLKLNIADPKRPWRTHSNKEKLLRIENELKQHIEKSSSAIMAMDEQQMKDLIKECKDASIYSPPIGANRLRETVEEARRNLPNFQYRIIENSTATIIFPEAHVPVKTADCVEEIGP